MTEQLATTFAAEETAAGHATGAWREHALQIAAGLGFAGLYGLAVGARDGGMGLLRNGLGAPLGLTVVLAVGVPALLVLLALLDAPVSPAEIGAGAARACSSTGLMLAGLAPATALLLVTIRSSFAAAWIVAGGLGLSIAIGGAPLFASTYAGLTRAGLSVRLRGGLLLAGFALFSLVLATRVWGALLPVLLGGGA